MTFMAADSWIREVHASKVLQIMTLFRLILKNDQSSMGELAPVGGIDRVPGLVVGQLMCLPLRKRFAGNSAGNSLPNGKFPHPLQM